jgi:hypothetical protein
VIFFQPLNETVCAFLGRVSMRGDFLEARTLEGSKFPANQFQSARRICLREMAIWPIKDAFRGN